MQDWGAPTGSLPVVRELLGLRSFSPQTVSVRAARRFVQECLAGGHLEALADDAGLLVCELAANAVLHARTDFDVAVSELHDGSGVRVTVRDDAAALPTLTAPSATAMSGRGLALVQTLAARWGAGPSAQARKGVWFELDLPADTHEEALAGTGAAGQPELSVEELLAAWSDSEPAPVARVAEDLDVITADASASSGAQAPQGRGADAGTETGTSTGTSADANANANSALVVELPALNAVDLLAAKEGMDDVLRELQLVLLDPRDRTTPSAASSRRADRSESGPAEVSVLELSLARRLDAAARAFDTVRRQVRQQVALAVAAGQEQVRLRLLLPPGTRTAAVEYSAAVEAAEDLAERGTLLGAGARALRRHRAVRRAYLGEVIAAASS